MRILFVDDETRRMAPIIEELLDEGHDVISAADVDRALALLADSGEGFDVAIVDVSMPAGQSFRSDETEGGTRTGLQFYEALRKLQPHLKVVVFTNVADRSVEEHFINQDPGLCRFIRKPSVLPFQFVEMIQEFVNQGG